MALNCAMLRPSNPPTPVPLPEEKTFLSVSGVEAVLHPMSNSTTLKMDSKPLKASGICYVTSQRVIFVSAAPPSTMSAGHELHSLSCNLSHFQDGRFVQPWFSANYYEGVVIPQTGGGLDCINDLKLHFNEGRAFEFYQALEEVRRRYEETRGRGAGSQEEALPLYTPGQSTGPSATTSSLPVVAQPAQEDVDVAHVARQAEAAEVDREVQAVSSDEGLPPSYEDAAGR